jgi:hypothetical protein
MYGHRVPLRCGPMTSLTIPKMALSIGFIRFVSSSNAILSYRVRGAGGDAHRRPTNRTASPVSNFGHIPGSAFRNVEPGSHANGRPTSFAHSRERSIRCGGNQPTIALDVLGHLLRRLSHLLDLGDLLDLGLLGGAIRRRSTNIRSESPADQDWRRAIMIGDGLRLQRGA